MALLKGSTPTAPTAKSLDEEVPEEIPRGRGKRPKIRALIDGVESRDRFETMTRASSLGGTIADKYRIHRWELRTVTFGMSRRPELVAQAAAVADNDTRENKDELQAIAELAHDAGGGNAGNIKGSALHKLSEQLDAGMDLSHLDSNVLEALRVYRQLLRTVRIVASETFVVCDELSAAGTFDRVVELLVDTDVTMPDEDGNPQVVATLPAGTRVVLDLKTNKDAKYFGVEYAVQQAVYGNGVPYTHRGGRGEWPDGIAPSTEWALILHLPVNSIDDAGFYWVDLTAGLGLGHLANRVREERSTAGDLFTPADLAPGHAATQVRVGLLQQIREADGEAAIGALYAANTDAWDVDCRAMANARMRELTLAAATAAPSAPAVEEDTSEEFVLVDAIAAVESEAELNALYAAHRADWGTAENDAARARIAELDKAAA